MLNPEIYKAAVPTITTEHVIITDKQLEHIRERHPDISATVMEQLTEIIHAPDYIIETDMPYTANILKHLEINGKGYQLVLRIRTDSDPEEFQNSVITFIQLNGTLHYTTFSGGTTVERFKRYLESDLLPHLNGNSVLIMDNMKSHHAKAVKELLDSSGVRYIYLPPYSPDLNPIEKLWSKVKALLRKFKARTLDALPNAIQNAFHSVTVSDCSGWFRFCGYAL